MTIVNKSAPIIGSAIGNTHISQISMCVKLLAELGIKFLGSQVMARKPYPI